LIPRNSGIAIALIFRYFLKCDVKVWFKIFTVNQIVNYATLVISNYVKSYKKLCLR
jgi:hypothetical protein